MKQNEYLKVWQISMLYKQTPRNVRRIISELVEEKGEELIHKDSNGEWNVHRLLLPKFKPQRERKEKVYALTLDPVINMTENEIDEVMMFVLRNLNDPNLEISYTIEKSRVLDNKFNAKNHVHCIVNCNQRKKLLQSLKLGFSKLSYKQEDIFDLNGWKAYITKDGSQIKTIKNQI